MEYSALPSTEIIQENSPLEPPCSFACCPGRPSLPHVPQVLAEAAQGLSTSCHLPGNQLLPPTVTASKDCCAGSPLGILPSPFFTSPSWDLALTSLSSGRVDSLSKRPAI